MGCGASNSNSMQVLLRVPATIMDPHSNVALIFIKPHADTPAVVQLVKDRFVEVGIELIHEGQVPGSEIEKDAIIDKHYSVIAFSALTTDPIHHRLTSKNKLEFHQLFGETWDDALDKKSIVTCANAAICLNLTDLMVSDMWDQSVQMKISRGLYVARLPRTDIYCINGFYPRMRRQFFGNILVRYFIVAFDSNKLNWGEFRLNFIGATAVTKAKPMSLRGDIYKRWKELGLRSEPTDSENSIHASAGPLEAIRERSIWLKIKVSQDLFGARLLKAGVPISVINRHLTNSMVNIGNEYGPSFELTEDKDSSYVLSQLVQYG